MSMVAQQAPLFAFYFQQRSCETLKIRQSFCRIYGVLETNNRTFGFDAVHNITVARFIVIFREEFTSFDPLSWCPVHEGADNVPRRMKNEPTIFLRFLLSIGHNTLLETIRKRSLYIAIFYRSIKYSLFRYGRGIDSTVGR